MNKYLMQNKETGPWIVQPRRFMFDFTDFISINTLGYLVNEYKYVTYFENIYDN